jgi:uridine phosphorylase
MDMTKREKQFHIQLGPEDNVGRYAILPGDPGRCESIARLMDEPVHVGMNREYNCWQGKILGERVTVLSTGIGGPSTAIAIEELAQLGVHTMIRCGTCGGIREDVQSGDLIVATGSVRMEGTTREYAPPEYPAVPDFDVTCALMQAAREEGRRALAGVVQCKDSFYGQHSPQTMPVAGELLARWEAWKRLGVLGSEMESSTLFVVGAARELRCGACFHVIWNQEREKQGLPQTEDLDTTAAVRVAVRAMGHVIEHDRQFPPVTPKGKM